MNKLAERRILWRDLEDISKNQVGPWGIIGDFNNVLSTRDRIGGRDVMEAEFADLRQMMDDCGLAEMDSEGEFYTWFNKHSDDPIYSRIDRIIGNIEWMQKHSSSKLTVLAPNVSDHGCLYLKDNNHTPLQRYQFKFSNCLTNMEGFLQTVSTSWNKPLKGKPMSVLWHKLRRLTPILRKMSKPLQGIQKKIEDTRNKLLQAQMELSKDRMSRAKIEQEKY
ncbi:uncharacterized protein LOC131630081 [Vicia villosa]|uniref:uncharacterized protein LOC131630081 n=1 Tax=Vicia villosa TaxID=3911 RepID=UPI00273BEEC5|nr:uncharacterized protein LOC131630081 [Vicia villosa]